MISTRGPTAARTRRRLWVMAPRSTTARVARWEEARAGLEVCITLPVYPPFDSVRFEWPVQGHFIFVGRGDRRAVPADPHAQHNQDAGLWRAAPAAGRQRMKQPYGRSGRMNIISI